MTRLMKSVLPSSGTCGGGMKTAICPSCGDATRYWISFARSTSLIARVGSIEPLGIQNVRTTKCMRTSATAPAMMNASRYSRTTPRCFSSGTAAGAIQTTIRATTRIPRTAPRTYGLIERELFLVLFDARRFASDAVLQVEELRATDDAAADDVDFVDARRMDEERALDADVMSDAPNREARRKAAVLALDDYAFEYLDALFVALGDAGVHAHRVADGELRGSALALVVSDECRQVHDHRRP